MEKQYEILASLPAYGPMYVSVSEYDKDFFSEGLAYDPTDNRDEWKAFVLDLDSRIIIGGSFW